MRHWRLMLEVGDILPVGGSETNIVVDRGLGHGLPMVEVMTLGLGRAEVMSLTRGRAREQGGEAGVHGLLVECSVSQHLGYDAILFPSHVRGAPTADIRASPGVKPLVCANSGHVASSNHCVVSKRYRDNIRIHPIIATILISCLQENDVVILDRVVIHEERIDVVHVHGELAHRCWCGGGARAGNAVVDAVVDVVDVPPQLGLLRDLQVLLVDQGGPLRLSWHRKMFEPYQRIESLEIN